MRRTSIISIAIFAAGTAFALDEAPPSHGVAGDPPPKEANARVLSCDGLLNKSATHAKLTEAYGPKNVVFSKEDGAEGETYMATVLFPKKDSDRLIVTWKDEKRHQNPDSLSVKSPGNRWTLPNGLRIGSKLAEVETINGKPFALSGFDWDYGGFVNDWKGGALGKGLGPCTIVVRFNPGEGAKADAASGDKTFSSNGAAMKTARPFVSEITLNWR